MFFYLLYIHIILATIILLVRVQYDVSYSEQNLQSIGGSMIKWPDAIQFFMLNGFLLANIRKARFFQLLS